MGPLDLVLHLRVPWGTPVRLDQRRVVCLGPARVLRTSKRTKTILIFQFKFLLLLSVEGSSKHGQTRRVCVYSPRMGRESLRGCFVVVGGGG